MSKDFNPVVKPATPDGLAGYDKNGDFYAFYDPHGFDRPAWVRASNVHDVFEHTCVLCNKGWERNVPALLDQHYSGDHVASVHKSCYERHLGFVERAMWIAVFHSVNYDMPGKTKDENYVALNKMLRSMVQIKNGYGSGWNTPWYTMSLLHFPGCPVPKMTFGSRRSVYNIEITRITPHAADLIEEAFKQEGTTNGKVGRDGFYTHAQTKEQAVEFVDRILGIVKEKGSLIQPEVANDAVPA